MSGRRLLSEARWRSSVCRLESIVESPNACEAGRECDLGERQDGFVDQPLCPLHSPRCGHFARACAQMLCEQAAKMPRADAQAFSQRPDAAAVQSALVDHAQGAPDRRRGATPGRASGRRLGPASQARAEACTFGSGGRREEDHIGRLCGPHRADRPTINSGRFHAAEEEAVESAITGQTRAIAYFRIDDERRDFSHGRGNFAYATTLDQPESDSIPG